MFSTYIITAYLLTWIFGGGICYLLNSIRKKRVRRNEIASFAIPVTTSKWKIIVGNCIGGCEKWMMIRVGKVPSHFIRMALYQHVFQMSVDKDVVIYSHCRFRKPPCISIGEGSVIGDNCWIDGRGCISIGKHCNLSSEVRIWSSQHEIQSPQFSDVKEEVIIGDRVWISSNAIILPGVSIGDGAVIAAGAVVTRNVEPYSIMAGVPAKKIGERTSELKYQFSGKHEWFM